MVTNAQLKKLWWTARSEGFKGCYTLVRGKLAGKSVDVDRASGISISRLKGSDAKGVNSRYKQWSDLIPLPPASLMFSVGAQSVENFLVVGDAWAQLVSRYTEPEASLLDIGCGCGRTARFLSLNPNIKSYTGFDVIRENIEWCQHYITPVAASNFNFLHYDIFSEEYNQKGTIKVDDFSFPAEDGSITVVFAASLFTHLREKDCRHYLSEISRVLTPGQGRAIISIHIDTTRDLPFKGTETRIDIDPDYFAQLLDQYNLSIKERIGEVCGQETFVIGHKR